MNRALVISAHPDDETLGMGGTWYKLQDQGWEMGVVWLTDGCSARKNPDLSKRNAGVKNALSLLKPDFYLEGDFPDNQLDHVSLLSVVKFIETAIEKFKPERIYIHSENELNIDHYICHRASITAARPFPGQSVKSIYAYEVVSSSHWFSSSDFNGNIFVDISSTFSKKITTLKCYDGEIPSSPHARSLVGIESLARFRGCTSGVELAEAFQLIRELQ